MIATAIHPVCPHRLDWTREVACTTCRGAVRRKFYGCSRHGECNLSDRTVEGARSCHDCSDRLNQREYDLSNPAERHLAIAQIKARRRRKGGCCS
jgi:hypothetical protein